QDGNARCLGMLMDGRAQATGIRRPGADATLLLILNAHDGVVNFCLPEVAQGCAWTCLIDTNRPTQFTEESYTFNHEFVVTNRSLLLFVLETKQALTAAKENKK